MAAMAQSEPGQHVNMRHESFWLRLKCSCGARLKAPPKAAGRTLACPGCGESVLCPKELPLKSLPAPDVNCATSQQLSAAGAIVTITQFNIDLLTAAGRKHEHESFRRDALRELRRIHAMIGDEPVIVAPPCPLERLALANHPNPPSVRWVPPDPTQHTADVAREQIRGMMDEVKLHGTTASDAQGFRRKPR